MNEQINKSIVEANNNMNKVQRDRQSAIISHHRFITKYNFDDESGKWCEFKLELAADTEKLLMVNIVEKSVGSLSLDRFLILTVVFIQNLKTENVSLSQKVLISKLCGIKRHLSTLMVLHLMMLLLC